MNINTATCLSTPADINALKVAAAKEKLRVEKEMKIADRSSRSDVREWKARYLALIDLERALGYLELNVTLTKKVPVL